VNADVASKLHPEVRAHASGAKAAWTAEICSTRLLHFGGVARTVADCFKCRNKIGLDVAMEALREAWANKQVSMDELWRYATLCRVANVMRPSMESLS